MSRYLTINEYMNTVENVAFKKGKSLSIDNVTNYPYSFGYALSTMKYTLAELQLTDKQIAILNERMSWLVKE